MRTRDKMTSVEAAAVLGTTVGALAQQRRRSTGPDFIIEGGRVYYLRSALAAAVHDPEGTAIGPGRDATPLMRPSEVAEWLNVTTGALAQWRFRRQGPAWTHVGRSIRYKRADVQAWLESRTHVPRE